MNPLHLAARNGPIVLVAGLVAGLLLPSLAEPMRPLLPPLVMLLLFVTVLRMEPKTLIGSLSDLHSVIRTIAALQLAVPLTLLAIGYTAGWMSSPIFLSLLIVAAAPSISGSPNMCLMMGHPAEHAVRLVVVGTALLPLTALPVFWLMPELEDIRAVTGASVRLFLTIAVAASAAIVLRLTVLRNPSAFTLSSLEGLGAITLAVFVIGLMPSLSATALEAPGLAQFWVAFACVINFGAQAVMFSLLRRRNPAAQATAISLIAGNRNIALFFVALPPEVIAPIMVFIGAYQIPMYLTPTLMRRLYRTNASDP